MKANKVLDNEFEALTMIAHRSIKKGQGITIEHEAVIHAGQKLRAQRDAMGWLLNRVAVGENGSVYLTNNGYSPNPKSLAHIYKAMGDHRPERTVEAVS